MDSTSVGLLLLRIGCGGYMATHGWGKLQMLLHGRFQDFGDPIGLGPVTSLVLVTLAEFACALLVVLGLWTRAAAAPVVFTMAVAAFGWLTWTVPYCMPPSGTVLPYAGW